MRNLSATPPAFSPAPKVSKEKVLLLPQTNHSATHAVEYLCRREIDDELIDFCIKTGRLYENSTYHNKDKHMLTLRHIGYGIPNVDKTIHNNEYHITIVRCDRSHCPVAVICKGRCFTVGICYAEQQTGAPVISRHSSRAIGYALNCEIISGRRNS